MSDTRKKNIVDVSKELTQIKGKISKMGGEFSAVVLTDNDILGQLQGKGLEEELRAQLEIYKVIKVVCEKPDEFRGSVAGKDVLAYVQSKNSSVAASAWAEMIGRQIKEEIGNKIYTEVVKGGVGAEGARQFADNLVTGALEKKPLEELARYSVMKGSVLKTALEKLKGNEAKTSAGPAASSSARDGNTRSQTPPHVQGSGLAGLFHTKRSQTPPPTRREKSDIEEMSEKLAQIKGEIISAHSSVKVGGSQISLGRTVISIDNKVLSGLKGKDGFEGELKAQLELYKLIKVVYDMPGKFNSNSSTKFLVDAYVKARPGSEEKTSQWVGLAKVAVIKDIGSKILEGAASSEAKETAQLVLGLVTDGAPLNTLLKEKSLEELTNKYFVMDLATLKATLEGVKGANKAESPGSPPSADGNQQQQRKPGQGKMR